MVNFIVIDNGQDHSYQNNDFRWLSASIAANDGCKQSCMRDVYVMQYCFFILHPAIFSKILLEELEENEAMRPCSGGISIIMKPEYFWA